MPDYDDILGRVREMIADVIGVAPDDVPVDESFDRLGLASRDAVMLSGDLQDWLGCDLPPSLLYEHSTPTALAAFLAGEGGDGGEVRARGSASLPGDANDCLDVARSGRLPLDQFEEGRL